MDLATVTSIVIAAVAVLLIAYDVWVKYKQPDGNATISWVVLSSSKRWPVIAFAFGFLMGHLFFQNCSVN
jgi:hypothetical protein